MTAVWPQPRLRPAGAPDSQAGVRQTREGDQFFEHGEKLGMKLKRAIADRCVILIAVRPLSRCLYTMAGKAGGRSCPFGNARGRGYTERWRQRQQTRST